MSWNTIEETEHEPRPFEVWEHTEGADLCVGYFETRDEAQHRYVVYAMDMAQGQGAEQMAFAIEQEEGAQ